MQLIELEEIIQKFKLAGANPSTEIEINVFDDFDEEGFEVKLIEGKIEHMNFGEKFILNFELPEDHEILD